MPAPLTTTLLAVAFLSAFIGEQGCFVLAGVLAGLALVLAGLALALEFVRFWAAGVEPAPYQREVLVKSGEPVPDEQGRTTLLRG